MSERQRRFLLICILIGTVLTAVGISISQLYGTAMAQQRERLVETAQSQARVIEAVARHDEIYGIEYPGTAMEATLAQIVDAHAAVDQRIIVYRGLKGKHHPLKGAWEESFKTSFRPPRNQTYQAAATT